MDPGTIASSSNLNAKNARNDFPSIATHIPETEALGNFMVDGDSEKLIGDLTDCLSVSTQRFRRLRKQIAATALTVNQQELGSGTAVIPL